MATFTSIFEAEITQALATSSQSAICQALSNVFQKAKTFHQFHQAWLTFEGYKYFDYTQDHGHESFVVYLENLNLWNADAGDHGITLHLTFALDYSLLEIDPKYFNLKNNN